jgi:hypothetical protein
MAKQKQDVDDGGASAVVNGAPVRIWVGQLGNGYKADPMTEAIIDVLYRYLTAWEDEKKLGELDFDECVSVAELSAVLAKKISGIP